MSAALSKDGVVGRKPLLGSYNTAHLIVFLNEIEQACQGEGVTYVIVWDNARLHHAEVVQTWLWAHSRFVTRYLPTYTPFLNPIEDLFPHGGGRCTITILLSVPPSFWPWMRHLTTSMQTNVKLGFSMPKGFTRGA